MFCKIHLVSLYIQTKFIAITYIKRQPLLSIFNFENFGLF
jgi:hypothetical protein